MDSDHRPQRKKKSAEQLEVSTEQLELSVESLEKLLTTFEKISPILENSNKVSNLVLDEVFNVTKLLQNKLEGNSILTERLSKITSDFNILYSKHQDNLNTELHKESSYSI